MPPPSPTAAPDLDIAIAAARKAGRFLATAFGTRGRVWYKSVDQPVTDADVEADRILRDALGAARPGYAWLSEEMDGEMPIGADHTWVVDPLDGTANFVAGRPEFAVCVGLLTAGVPTLGVVYDPISDVLYAGTTGGGATRNGAAILARRDSGDRRVLVASSREIRSGKLDAFLRDWEPTTLGSTALKMMRVAEGGADAYVSGTDKGIWDYCAGAVIVEEAGGIVRDLRGNPVDFGSPTARTRGLIVVGRDAEARIPNIAELARTGGLSHQEEGKQ